MSIETVIHLKKSKRFLDVHLPEITTAMRTCTPAAPLSEDHLRQLRTRKIENCKKELETDFFKHGHVVGMYWENIARSMVERAHRDARQLDVPLFCLQAADQRHARKNKTIDKQLTHQLLTVPNPHRTGKLQGMLLVHENMIARLSDVLAPHLGLVKDKMAMVVKVDLHHEDQERLRDREAGFCHFVPEYMAKGIWVKLLKGKSSPMEGQFENVADHTDDAKTLFFVELMHADFKIDLKIGEENEKVEVIRWQFPLLHGMLRTAYSAQGLIWMEVCWLICVVLVAWRMMTGGSPYMLCWRVPVNWKISFYWAWLTKWKIFYAEGPLLIFENWLTSWKPKVLPRWSACRTGLCMTQCKLPDIILCIWIQPLVGGAICWNKRWLNVLEVYWHVWCLLFILLICWQVVSWHDLACLVQRMHLVTHCNAFVIWACAVAATIAFDFASGGMLPCLMPDYWYLFDRWYPDMIWHVWCIECF